MEMSWYDNWNAPRPAVQPADALHRLPSGEIFDVRTTAMSHKCRRCGRVMAPQMVVAIFDEDLHLVAYEHLKFEGVRCDSTSAA